MCHLAVLLLRRSADSSAAIAPLRLPCACSYSSAASSIGRFHSADCVLISATVTPRSRTACPSRAPRRRAGLAASASACLAAPRLRGLRFAARRASRRRSTRSRSARGSRGSRCGACSRFFGRYLPMRIFSPLTSRDDARRHGDVRGGDHVSPSPPTAARRAGTSCPRRARAGRRAAARPRGRGTACHRRR